MCDDAIDVTTNDIMCHLVSHDSYIDEGVVMTSGMVHCATMTTLVPHDISKINTQMVNNKSGAFIIVPYQHNYKWHNSHIHKGVAMTYDMTWEWHDVIVDKDGATWHMAYPKSIALCVFNVVLIWKFVTWQISAILYMIPMPK